MSTDLLPPRYAEPRLIGRGGMGEIYLALDLELDRRVAVKLLDEGVAANPDLRARFRREGLTAARLSGERHVVTIFDVGEHRDRPFIVMEYLPGGTLAERGAAGSAPREQTLEWLDQAAVALDAAHARGVVHRDVKPANLLLDGRDQVTVVDFGIARLSDQTAGMTAPGTVLGTAGYLAPEQAQGRPATPASDRYALAVVAYELLTGGRPFERGSATAEAAAHIHEPVPPASQRGIGLPAAVDGVFERALAKDPEHRYPTAAAFTAALRNALGGETAGTTRLLPAPPAPPAPAAPPAAAAPRRPERRRPALPLIAGAVLVAALLLGGFLLAESLSQDDQRTPAPAEQDSPEPQTVTQEVTVEGEVTTVVETVTDPGEEPEAPPTGGGGDLDPQEAAALNDEAFAHMQQGRWQAALPLLERAVPALEGTYSAGFPNEAYAEYNLGRTLAELDRCDEAVPHLERSEQLQGERSEITQTLETCS